MIVTGYNINGYNFVGKKTFESIGNVVWYREYPTSFVGAPARILDLSGNNLTLFPDSAAFTDLGDGWGSLVSTINAIGTTISSAMNVFHKDRAFAYFCVCKIDDIGTTNVLSFYKNNIGFEIRTDLAGGNKRMRVLFPGIANINSSNNLITTGEFCLLRVMFKTTGAGTNNLRITYKNITSLHTVASMTTAGDVSDFRVSKQGGQTDLTIKLDIAYDLTGKTSAEVDAFELEFINVMKTYPAYSSLITS